MPFEVMLDRRPVLCDKCFLTGHLDPHPLQTRSPREKTIVTEDEGMCRFFARRRAFTFDLAALALAVFLAVSVADIDDYGAIDPIIAPPVTMTDPPGGATEVTPPSPEAGTGSEHACACLLCTLALSDSAGIRVLPPSAEKAAAPLVARVAGSRHAPEVFRPPSA